MGKHVTQSAASIVHTQSIHVSFSLFHEVFLLEREHVNRPEQGRGCPENADVVQQSDLATGKTRQDEEHRSNRKQMMFSKLLALPGL